MAAETLAELRRTPHRSYSSISTFLNICSLQWAFRYVYRREPSHTPAALVFGSTFHSALEYTARKRMAGTEASPGAAAALFGDVFGRLTSVAGPPVRYPEGQDAATLAATGRRMVGAYLETVPADERVTAVSQPFRVQLADAEGLPLPLPLIGEFDCVVASETGPLIVDWKSAARRWPKGREHTDLQPVCYLYADGRRDVRFRFDIVTKTKEPAVERRLTTRHADHFIRLAERVKVMETMIRQEHFLPADGSWACRDCPYREPCAEWHRRRSRSLHSFALTA